MKKWVICFLVQGNEVIILGRRKNPRRPWHKMLSGFGGKVDEGETPEQAQVRELEEEAGVVAREEDLSLGGKIILNLNGEKVPLLVYVLEKWKEEPRETEEMSPERCSIFQIPFGEMTKGDELWLPWILAGYFFEGQLKRGQNLNELESFKFTQFSFQFWS